MKGTKWIVVIVIIIVTIGVAIDKAVDRKEARIKKRIEQFQFPDSKLMQVESARHIMYYRYESGDVIYRNNTGWHYEIKGNSK